MNVTAPPMRALYALKQILQFFEIAWQIIVHSPDRQTIVTLISYRSRSVKPRERCLMAKAAAHFDAQTIALLKVALDEAWDRLPPKLQATMLKTTLAERILKSAAEGERDRERLREAALRDLAA